MNAEDLENVRRHIEQRRRLVEALPATAAPLAMYEIEERKLFARLGLERRGDLVYERDEVAAI